MDSLQCMVGNVYQRELTVTDVSCFRAALNDFAVHVERQRLDTLAQLFYEFGQLRILLQQLQELASLLSRQCLALFAGHGEGFPMLCVGIGVRLVAVCLSCLCKQDEWGSIGGLETESEIEQDKRVDIELW